MESNPDWWPCSVGPLLYRFSYCARALAEGRKPVVLESMNIHTQGSEHEKGTFNCNSSDRVSEE